LSSTTYQRLTLTMINSHPVGLYGEYVTAGITHGSIVKVLVSSELMFVLHLEATSRCYMIATLV
jgi:hypothetical protein